VSESRFPRELQLDCGPVAAIDLALFAAASGDHNPLHLDAEVARTAGFPRPVVHGMLTMAYAGRLLTRHFGPGSLRSLRTRFTGVATLGDTILLGATLEKVEGELGHYNLRAQAGTGAELARGLATVRLSSGECP
jgi:acyl dehydratase